MQRHRPAVSIPVDLVDEMERTLVALDAARAALQVATSTGAPLPVRRAAHAAVSAAFDAADRPLRQATTLARSGPYLAWRDWRRRLSTLDTAKQRHLFAEMDLVGGLGQGSIQAVDTGMSGPSIGDIQHGETRPPGSPATYGLDMAAVLTPVPLTAAVGPVPAPGPDRDPVPISGLLSAA